MGSIILSREGQQIFMSNSIVCHICILEKWKRLRMENEVSQKKRIKIVASSLVILNLNCLWAIDVEMLNSHLEGGGL